MKQQTKINVTLPEPTNFSNIRWKADGYPAPAQVDRRTLLEDLIDCKFIHLHCIPTILGVKKTLRTTIEASQAAIDKE